MARVLRLSSHKPVADAPHAAAPHQARALVQTFAVRCLTFEASASPSDLAPNVRGAGQEGPLAVDGWMAHLCPATGGSRPRRAWAKAPARGGRRGLPVPRRGGPTGVGGPRNLAIGGV